jgi:alkylation response protein AidB-like acyl-CoA dehydrogenase
VTHYRSDLTDLRFNFDVLGVADYWGAGPHAAVDVEQARMLLAELDRFARSDLWAGSFATCDRAGLHLDETGDVTIPDELDRALTAYYDAGWHLLPLPEHLGGAGAPAPLRWAAAELLSGGHAAASLWPIGPLMATIIDAEGTTGQRSLAHTMLDERFGATMVLTEPDAGSDVGAARTRATLIADNGTAGNGTADNGAAGGDLGSLWRIDGTKRFITSADAQTHPNTLHLVLARPDGAPAGTKGLSLFLVPKHHLADHPEHGIAAGARNGVQVAALEHKMGLNASATCELTFSAGDTPAYGYLLGDTHDGIRQMFHVIEYARMMVATKAMATLSTGHLNAVEYARTRHQGPDLTRAGDRDAPKVAIIDHADVRRMLLDQKAHAEAMRALVLYIGWVQDQGVRATDAGEVEAAASWQRREDLLLPLAKGWCSERAYDLLGSSVLQTFGGSGYTRDYPIEQYVRDAKIDTLYEGTTGIQAMDLLWRKIVRDQGHAYGWLRSELAAAATTADGTADGTADPLAGERAQLADALDALDRHLGVLLGHGAASRHDGDTERIHLAGLHTTALLHTLAETVAAMLLLRQADHALTLIGQGDAGYDRVWLDTKVGTVRWFCRTVLAHAAVRAAAAETEDGLAMHLTL